MSDESPAQIPTVGMVIDAMIDEIRQLRQSVEEIVQVLLVMNGVEEEQ